MKKWFWFQYVFWTLTFGLTVTPYVGAWLYVTIFWGGDHPAYWGW